MLNILLNITKNIIKYYFKSLFHFTSKCYVRKKVDKVFVIKLNC